MMSVQSSSSGDLAVHKQRSRSPADEIKVGTCGFGRVKRPEYVQLFPVVEIQHTFYHPPEIKTLEKWRRELPDDF